MNEVVDSRIVSQNFWKNIGWRPSGPGALNGLKDLKALSISTRETGRSSKSFSSFVSLVQLIWWFGICKDLTASVFYNWTTWDRTICLSFKVEFDQFPDESLRPKILLWCLRQTVERWKMEMFLSPRLDHWMRYFRAQNSSFNMRIFWYWQVRSLSRSSKAEQGRKMRDFWMPFKQANKCFFLWKIFQKTSRFLFRALFVKSLISKLTSWGKHNHESLTRLGKEGSLNHIVSIQKGRGLKTCWVRLVSMRMGLWSEDTLGGEVKNGW